MPAAQPPFRRHAVRRADAKRGRLDACPLPYPIQSAPSAAALVVVGGGELGRVEFGDEGFGGEDHAGDAGGVF